MQVVTQEFLKLGVSSQISEKQLTLLDVNETNWEEDALGKNISDARAELFVLLKDITAKTNQDKIIKNYKVLQAFRKGEVGSSEEEIVKKEEGKAEIKPVLGDVVVYCDGGCSPNPGASGSGIAVYRGFKISELWYGLYESNGTNNTAELNALYSSLEIAQKESALGNKVEIKCDSMYSINCIKIWAKGWESKDWTKKGGVIKNLEIIKKAYFLYNTISSKISLSHIKAHAGAEGNELADRMTHYTRKTKEPKLVKYDKNIDISEIFKMGS